MSLVLRAVDRCPQPWRGYLTLARLQGAGWFYLFPGLWSIALASHHWPSVWLIVVFAIAAVLVHGAGSTINDVVDRKADRLIERTASRPVAAGDVTPGNALVFAAAQTVVLLALLALVSIPAAVVTAVSYPLIIIYPFMKRITYWPQAWLGVVFNWYALAGWIAITHKIQAPALLLWAAGSFWTLGYDTIYAQQDKKEDVGAGVKSTAIRLGAASRAFIAVFYSLFFALIIAAGAAAGINRIFYLLLIPAAVQLGWQLKTLDIDDPTDCQAKFLSNRLLGWLVLGALTIAQVITVH
jgi:4-hydroxybenzoate polyprenyltransferase